MSTTPIPSTTDSQGTTKPVAQDPQDYTRRSCFSIATAACPGFEIPWDSDIETSDDDSASGEGSLSSSGTTSRSASEDWSEVSSPETENVPFRLAAKEDAKTNTKPQQEPAKAEAKATTLGHPGDYDDAGVTYSYLYHEVPAASFSPHPLTHKGSPPLTPLSPLSTSLKRDVGVEFVADIPQIPQGRRSREPSLQQRAPSKHEQHAHVQKQQPRARTHGGRSGGGGGAAADDDARHPPLGMGDGAFARQSGVDCRRTRASGQWIASEAFVSAGAAGRDEFCWRGRDGLCGCFACQRKRKMTPPGA